MPEGDDLAITLFLLSLALPAFGFEAMKAETIPRRITFAVLAVLCLLAATFWLDIKQIWPAFTLMMVSIATDPVSWLLVLMFVLAVFALHRPKKQEMPADHVEIADLDVISLPNLCCYLAYESKWAQSKTTHSPTFAISVSNEIRDALFQGKIEATGRPFSPERPLYLKMESSPRPISSSWWDGKFIDAWRAMSDIGIQNVVYEDSQQRSGYHDITVKRTEAEALWPPA
jgi:hypothetical protein